MKDELHKINVGAFDGYLQPGLKAALIIVDVVRAYLDPQSPLYLEGEAAVNSNIRLAAAARAASMPIIYTNIEYQNQGSNGGYFYQKVPALRVFDSGSPMGAFDKNLSPHDGDTVITKQYASAFFGTSLASTLRAMNVDTVLVSGFSTSGCIRASALDALQHGFIPFVIADACADRHQQIHDSNLFDLQAKYAEVISEIKALEIIAANGKSRQA